MKNLLAITTMALLMLSTTVFTVSLRATTPSSPPLDDTPAGVKAQFARKYPSVKKVKWGKEGSNYEAEFSYQGKEMSAVLDAKGAILETETEIAVSALPKAVRDYVASHHRGKKISEGAEIVDATGKKTYEAEVGGKDLLFDANGQLIK